MKKIKICFLTSTRADYGLMKNLIKRFKSCPDLETYIIAGGTHFLEKFGNTFNEIKEDSLKIDIKIKINISDDSTYGSAKFFSLFSDKFNKALQKIKPDLLIILGDRFETLSAASVAVIQNIPICHLHGGESSEGQIDESIRHAITKLSSLHFVSHKKYKKRVIQLGENPTNVHHVGALGLNLELKKKILLKSQLESLLKINMKEKNIIVTFHPVTLMKDTTKDLKELFNALIYFKNIFFLITSPNMDPDHNKIIKKIKVLVKKKKNIDFVKSLGKEKYFNSLNFFDGVLGNSSSGIIEVPSFKKGTINIGDRQKGRVQAKSIINCKPKKNEIIKAIKKLYSIKFQNTLKNIKNPYYKKNPEEKILNIVKKTNLKKINKKTFFDYI